MKQNENYLKYMKYSKPKNVLKGKTDNKTIQYILIVIKKNFISFTGCDFTEVLTMDVF